ncbi:hypothetical protein ABIE09_002403 [Lysobacter enzymogenes]
MPRHRVRFVFINCPSIATEPMAYLLLAQNKQETPFQFEMHHYWMVQNHNLAADRPIERITRTVSDRLPRWRYLERLHKAQLERRAAPGFAQPISHNDWHKIAKGALDTYDRWTESKKRNGDSQPCPSIVITETPIEGNYFSLCDDGIALISLANWRRFFSPSSAAEFVLSASQRVALRLVYGDEIRNHNPTRGCIWDFCQNLADAKVSCTLAYLCETCEANLRKVAEQKQIDEVKQLISNAWIGDTGKIGTVAYDLKKLYAQDLHRASAHHVGLWSAIKSGMKSDAGKLVLDVLKSAGTALLVVFLALKFPDVSRLIKSGPPEKKDVTPTPAAAAGLQANPSPISVPVPILVPVPLAVPLPILVPVPAPDPALPPAEPLSRAP